MTLIDLDEIGKQEGISQVPGDFYRSAKGTPYVGDPDGTLVKSGPRKGQIKRLPYGRPSSLGKDIENTYNLERWNERIVALGLLTPGEHQRLNEAINRFDAADPTDEKAVKSALDGIVIEAKRVAKGYEASEHGTHTHELTEIDDLEGDPIARMERGESLGLPIPVQHALLAAWRKGVEAYGLVMLEVERKVVHDGWHQAGTLDRLVMLTRDIRFANGVVLEAGTVLLLDVKTGKLTLTAGGLVQYWHSYAIQCAIYAASVPYDPDTDTRGEWEREIDQRWAIIAHLPVKEALAGKATLRLVLCDIAAGREAVEQIVTPMKAWGSRRDLFHFTEGEEPIEIPVEGEGQTPAADVESLYRMYLTTRLAQIAEHVDAKARMVALWPAGVPGLKSGHTHSADELSAIEDVITRIEAMHELPFLADPRPREVPEPPTPKPRRWHAPDEGEILTMDHPDVAAMRRRIEGLAPADQSLAESWMGEAVAAGRGFALRQLPSRRRLLIYRVALDLVATFQGELSAARATLSLAIPDAEQLSVTLGCALGSLSVDEAERLIELIPMLAKEQALIFDGDTPRWSAATAA